jgi:hemerythrin
MPLRWEPHLAIGVAAIDDQHQELFRNVNALLAAMRGRRGAAEVPRLLDFLGRYAVEHFAGEERLMREVRYPGLEAHRREHTEFAQDFQALRQEYEAGGATPAVVVRLNVWLCGWLRRHVSDTDQDMGRYLADRPPGAPDPAGGPARS